MRTKNIESPFTEIYSILKGFENSDKNNSDHIKIIHQHVDNAIYTLLQGLQDFGIILSELTQHKNQPLNNLNNFGYFISAICNLTEVLHQMRTDADYILNQGNVSNY